LDYNGIKQKGKEHAKHTISGLYQAQAKEGAFDKAVELKEVSRIASIIRMSGRTSRLILDPLHASSTLTKSCPLLMKLKTPSLTD
jgi:hypothetical protein